MRRENSARAVFYLVAGVKVFLGRGQPGCRRAVGTLLARARQCVACQYLAYSARPEMASISAKTTARLAASFTGKSCWESRLSDIIKAIEVLGRARRVDDGRWMG